MESTSERPRELTAAQRARAVFYFQLGGGAS